MGWNSAEEGLLLQRGNPSHTSWARPGFAAAALVWLAGVLLPISTVTGLPWPVVFVLIFGAGCAVGYGVYRAGARYAARRQAAFAAEARATQQAERARQLDEARASGAFDRFGKS